MGKSLAFFFRKVVFKSTVFFGKKSKIGFFEENGFD